MSTRAKPWGYTYSRPRGISLLLELLLGLSLVCLTLLVLFSVFPTGDRAVAQADRTSQAASKARSLMEQTLGKDYNDLSTDPATYLDEDDAVHHTKRHGHDLSTQFHCRVEITQPRMDKEVKRVLVIVSWRNGSDREQKVRLEASKGKLW